MGPGRPDRAVKVSVVVRTANSEENIGRVLEAVAAQSFEDHELVVVDSGSTDGTLEIMGHYPHTFVDYSGREFTYSGSLNAGISAARGEFIVCVSSHCVPLGGEWLGSLVGAMEADGRLAGAWGPLIFGAGEAPDDEGAVETMDLEDFYRRPNYGLQNSNSIIRRELWEERHFSMEVPTCEDQVWAHHFLRRGYLTAQVRGAPVTYRIPQGPYVYGRKLWKEFLTLNELFGYRPGLPVTEMVRRMARLAGAAMLGRRSLAVSARIAGGMAGIMLAGWTVRYREWSGELRRRFGKRG